MFLLLCAVTLCLASPSSPLSFCLSTQSKLGYLTLFLCTFHTYLYGWNKFLSPSNYRWYTPPGYMLSLVLPSIVLVVKLLLLVPCVDRSLTRIRQGWERTDPEDASKQALLM